MRKLPPPARPGPYGETRVENDWAGTCDSVLYMLHIRNAGSRTLDLAGYALFAGTCRAEGNEPLILVRGSFTLNPGDDALIITHPIVPDDDEPRLEYANVYRRDGMTITPDSSFALTDAAGERPDVATGPIMAVATVGECCTPADQSECCIDFGNPACLGNGGSCWALVTRSKCCNVLNGCGWRASQLAGCGIGCRRTVTWNCCNSATCP